VAQQMISEQAFSPEAIAELGGGPRAARRMSAGGTVVKGLFLLVVTCGFAVLGWDQAAKVISTTSGPSWLLWYFLLIAVTFLAIARPKLAPLGGLVYSVLMGFWIGGISRVYDNAHDGIVAQALLATLAVVLVCLVLYALGVVKVTRRFVLVVVAATLGIGIVYLTGSTSRCSTCWPACVADARTRRRSRRGRAGPGRPSPCRSATHRWTTPGSRRSPHVPLGARPGRNELRRAPEPR
jgi:uncharacterized YccA/Bax inhibitor family protein